MDVDRFLNMKMWSFQQLIKKVLKNLIKCQRVLDIGCGLGASLNVLRAMGFDAYGIEVGVESWQFASVNHQNRVHLGELETAGFKPNFFGLVTLFDVIEHLENPVRTLKEIGRILEHEGIVYIITPNISSANSRLLRGHWYQYKPNEHLFYFSPHSLVALLHLCGFVDILTSRVGMYTNIERVSHVLRKTNPLLSKPFRWISDKLQIQGTKIWIPSGHVAALARKRREKETT